MKAFPKQFEKMASFPVGTKPSIPLLFGIAEYENNAFVLSDRYILNQVQRVRNDFLFIFSVFFTFITSIELIFPIPLILFCLGADAAGTIVLTYALVLVFGTQLFKRFLWRPRPWMLDETVFVWKRDKTSSFPSRGVVCSVVFCFVLSDVAHWDHPVWLTLLVAFVSISTAFSRLYLGAHFLSDVISGLIIGFLLVLLSRHFVGSWWSFLGCDILTNPGTCYGSGNILHLVFSKLLSLAVLTVVLWCLTLVLTCRPIIFWSKSALSFGLMFPPLLFRYLFLCNPEENDKDALGFVLDRSWLLSCIGMVGPLLLWSAGWYITKNGRTERNILYYTILFASGCFLLGICSLQRVSS
ncbi:uncharacterized protein Gasu_08240 [Galdieria sulphuraria]|uniref:Phosphatidic acid phosphatase type 2/haloperoxidase domain-containing protein n=1 Tax=Galdieria sulphuraria TaxID=130081 RepID=M2X6D5_GALSU|nr:uncharacterized protein Gasu_08240 [Galdieria sulphuraria]EME32080.1 hypothetical protein Gasu_08240 [Galdieria sulphuraria]|eukprot:XP_005708600.1 hypothetical protein Gasu_08240 [Galdieria sulphuraria]